MNLLHVFLFFMFAECIFWLKFPKEKVLWKRANAYAVGLDIAKLFTTGSHHFALKRRNGFEWQCLGGRGTGTETGGELFSEVLYKPLCPGQPCSVMQSLAKNVFPYVCCCTFQEAIESRTQASGDPNAVVHSQGSSVSLHPFPG